MTAVTNTVVNGLTDLPSGLANLGVYSSYGPNAVIIGDSYGAQEVALNATQNTYNANGLFTMLNGWLGSPLSIQANLAVAGNRTDQWFSQIAASAAYSPAYLLLFCGYINDVSQGVSSATIIANLRAAYTAMSLLGVRLIHATGIATSFAGALDTYAKRAVFFEVHEYLTRRAAIEFPGITVLDAYSPTVISTTGAPVVGASTDGLHPNDYGVNLMLPSCYNTLLRAGFIPNVGYGGYEDYRNLLVTPGVKSAGLGGGTSTSYFGNGTGGINAGTVTPGWSASNEFQGAGINGTWSTVARTDGPTGLWSRCNIASGISGGVGWRRFFDYSAAANTTWAATTAATAGTTAVVPTVANGYIYRCTTSGTTGGSQPTWPTKAGQTVTDGTVVWVAQVLPSPGDKIRMRVEFRFPNAASQKGKYFFRLQTLGVAYTSAWAFNQTVPHDNLPAQTLVAEVPELTMPSGAVTEFSAGIFLGGGGGTSLDMDIGRCFVWVSSRTNFNL